MQFIKYLAVGLMNTLVGYGVFFLLVRYSKIYPEIANASFRETPQADGSLLVEFLPQPGRKG